MNIRRVWAGWALIASMALVLTILLTSRFYLAFAWFLASESALFMLAARITTGWRRAMAANLSLCLLVLFAFEIYFWVRQVEMPPPEVVRSGDYVHRYHDWHHPILGYGPIPDNAVTSTKHINGRWLYTVRYTIGKDGLRVPPPDRGEAVEGSALFFGGSFTIGEGVEDHEALPYRVGLLGQGRFAVRNFGFHGYGPHQMLAALESDFVRERAPTPVRYAIYSGISYHDHRILGTRWDLRGPWYTLDADGQVVRKGRFSDRRETRSDRIERWLRERVGRSCLGNELLSRLWPEYTSDSDLYLAIVEAAAREAERRFPGCEFHVIYWDLWPEGVMYADALRKRGLRVHQVTRIIPGIEDDFPRYLISDLDRHPNAESLDLVARYVVRHILRISPDENRAAYGPPR